MKTATPSVSTSGRSRRIALVGGAGIGIAIVGDFFRQDPLKVISPEAPPSPGGTGQTAEAWAGNIVPPLTYGGAGGGGDLGEIGYDSQVVPSYVPDTLVTHLTLADPGSPTANLDADPAQTQRASGRRAQPGRRWWRRSGPRDTGWLLGRLRCRRRFGGRRGGGPVVRPARLVGLLGR